MFRIYRKASQPQRVTNKSSNRRSSGPQSCMRRLSLSPGNFRLATGRPMSFIMRNQMVRIIILLLVVVLMSCSKSLDIQLEPEVSLFLNYDTERRIQLTQKDEVYVILNEWLHENKSDWYATSGRYPGGVYVKSGKYGIQITETHVVIYSTTSNEPRAIYIQGIKKGELSKISDYRK